jgi:archaellum component FlaC
MILLKVQIEVNNISGKIKVTCSEIEYLSGYGNNLKEAYKNFAEDFITLLKPDEPVTKNLKISIDSYVERLHNTAKILGVNSAMEGIPTEIEVQVN